MLCIVCNYLPWRSAGDAQGQKSILCSNFTVLNGEFNPLNPLKRITLGAKVKVMKGHVPGIVWCESSSLLNVPRAALTVNRYGEASENHSENTTERIRRAHVPVNDGSIYCWPLLTYLLACLLTYRTHRPPHATSARSSARGSDPCLSGVRPYVRPKELTSLLTCR